MHLILWACVLSLSVSPRLAHAELTIDVRVRTTGEPQAVTGFIVTRDHTSQRAVKNYRRASDGTIVVTIPLAESEATGFAVASAMIKDKNGNTTFGELRPTADPTLRVSFVDIPQCEIPELDTASSTVKILS
ncbi:MAG: hypothetical protein KDD53_12260, partial [Bdellovibrionales bacterium]|nr:hypothetical protein [Bdellovibrionales bacterium]